MYFRNFAICGKRIGQRKTLFFAIYLFFRDKKIHGFHSSPEAPKPDYIKQEKCNSRIYLLFIVLPHGLLKTRLKIT